MMDQDQDNRPQMVVRDGSLKATVWENQGEKGPYHTITLAKTYEDAKGNLRDTNSFYQSELLRVAELGRTAYGRINDVKRDRAKSRKNEDREAFNTKRNGKTGPAPTQDYDL